MPKLTQQQKVARREMFRRATLAAQYTDCSMVPRVEGNTVFALREELAGFHARYAAKCAFMAHPELRVVA